MALVPEDRARQGFLREWSVARNISLPYLPGLSRGRFLPDRRREEDLADRAVADLAIVTGSTETPVGSLFILQADSRAAVDAFTSSDPYHVNNVWETVDVHYYNKKR